MSCSSAHSRSVADYPSSPLADCPELTPLIVRTSASTRVYPRTVHANSGCHATRLACVWIPWMWVGCEGPRRGNRGVNRRNHCVTTGPHRALAIVVVNHHRRRIPYPKLHPELGSDGRGRTSSGPQGPLLVPKHTPRHRRPTVVSTPLRTSSGSSGPELSYKPCGCTGVG